MSKSNKEKRIKKLGNIKLWPSVVAVSFSFIISIVAIIFFGVFIFTMSLENILELSPKDIENINTELQRIDSERKDYNLCLSELNERWDRIYAIQMYDVRDRIIASNGQVFNKNDIIWTLDLRNGFRLVYDIDFKERINSMNHQDVKDELNTESKVIYEHPVWLISKRMDSGNYFVFCSSIILSSKIFLADLVMLFVLFVISIIPIVFLIINIVRNIHYNLKIKNILYTDVETGGHNWIFFEEKAKKILEIFNKESFAIVELHLVNYPKYQTFHSTYECQSLMEYFNKLLNSNLNKIHSGICKEMAAHVSKDDFVMLLKVTGCADIKSRIQEIIDSFTNEKSLNVNAGYYLIPGNETRKERKELNLEVLYNNASMAQRSLQENKENSVIEFNNEILNQQIWENKIIERIDDAIAKQEFKVYIQPKYNPITENLSGAEALIRWINDEDGFIGPGRFIPIYEKTGLITKIDDFMLDNVAKLQSEWQKQGYKLVPISVNVSRAHFMQDNLAEHIASIVDKYELPHKYIEIELTESAFFDDKEKLLKIVHEIKNLGFEVSMDDFGAGYSSLNSLKDLPLDILKLDAEFFRGESEIDRAKIIVGDAINLAKHLNMRIVAEGIEKKEQVELLASMGCDMIQGFYYSKPLPVIEYEEKMEK